MSGREVTSVEGWKAGRVLTVCWEDSAALALYLSKLLEFQYDVWSSEGKESNT